MKKDYTSFHKNMKQWWKQYVIIIYFYKVPITWINVYYLLRMISIYIWACLCYNKVRLVIIMVFIYISAQQSIYAHIPVYLHFWNKPLMNL